MLKKKNIVSDYLQRESQYKDKKEILGIMADWIRRASDRIANEKAKEQRRLEKEERRNR